MTDKKKLLIVKINKDLLKDLPKDSYEVLDQKNFEPEQIVKLEKQVFDFFTLSQMGKSLLAIQKIDELSYVFLSSVHEASEAANCTLFLYDEKDESFKCVKAIGLDPKKVGEINF